MVATTTSWIERTPGVVGGDACIRQTRIAVWMLAEMRRQGMSTRAILASYPGLTADDLTAAWEYEEAHAEEIETAISENAAA